jgi:hypothetical protein
LDHRSTAEAWHFGEANLERRQKENPIAVGAKHSWPSKTRRVGHPKNVQKRFGE